MMGLSNLFTDLRDSIRNLLEPFESFSTYFQNFLEEPMEDVNDNLGTMKLKQKERRKYADTVKHVRFKQFSGVKVVPRNRPYQRRNY